LSYSKKDNPSNSKTKYAINKLNCLYNNKELFEDDGTIEHILPETDELKTLNIGNLILLEKNLNDEAGNKTYINKLSVYEKSKYIWINKFLQEYKMWDCSNVLDRSLILAQEYYIKIFNRPLPVKSHADVMRTVINTK